MSDLVVIAFPTEAKAEEVRQKILELQKEYLIELGDAAIAVKQPDGPSSSISSSTRPRRGPSRARFGAR